MSSVSLCKDELEIGGAKLFRQEDFVICDDDFNGHSGNVEFRFSGRKPVVYLVDVLFVFGITQSLCKSKGCWFLNERLGRQQVYLKRYLESARLEGMVRRYKVTNYKSWIVVKRSNPTDEKLITIQEPHAQLYTHTKTSNGTLSYDLECWARCCAANAVKLTKFTYKNFDYNLRNKLREAKF